tara:strand:+ start:171 stop:422 length:252 start_codon:yes stop_codon:yes gene_type:complete
MNTKIQKEQRDKELLELIKRQTNYDNKTIKEKLKKWNNNYIYVIKEYINPNFQEKKKEKEKTLNQQIMTEIRNFCNNKIIKKN